MTDTLTKFMIVPAIMVGSFAGCAMDSSQQITMTQETASSEGEGTNSVRFHRTSLTRAGEGQAAMQFAQEVRAYLNTNYAEISIELYTEVFGDVGRLHWFAGYPSLAALERVQARLQSDAGFQKLVARAPEVLERPQDTLMLLVP